MGNFLSSITSIYDHSKSLQDELSYKRQLLQCSIEQLQVEVETLENLEHSIQRFQNHLTDLEQRRTYLTDQRTHLLQVVESEKLAHEKDKKEEKLSQEQIEDFEQKYRNTLQFLNGEIMELIDSINEKIELYEAKVNSLQWKIQEMREIRQQTEHNAQVIQHEIDELVQLARKDHNDGGDGVGDGDGDEVMMLEEGGGGSGGEIGIFVNDEQNVQEQQQRLILDDSLSTMMNRQLNLGNDVELATNLSQENDRASSGESEEDDDDDSDSLSENDENESDEEADNKNEKNEVASTMTTSNSDNSTVNVQSSEEPVISYVQQTKMEEDTSSNRFFSLSGDEQQSTSASLDDQV